MIDPNDTTVLSTAKLPITRTLKYPKPTPVLTTVGTEDMTMAITEGQNQSVMAPKTVTDKLTTIQGTTSSIDTNTRNIQNEADHFKHRINHINRHPDQKKAMFGKNRPESNPFTEMTELKLGQERLKTWPKAKFRGKKAKLWSKSKNLIINVNTKNLSESSFAVAKIILSSERISLNQQTKLEHFYLRMVSFFLIQVSFIKCGAWSF